MPKPGAIAVTRCDDLKRHEEALDPAMPERSGSCPTMPKPGATAANALDDLKRHEEALACYERSIEVEAKLC